MSQPFGTKRAPYINSRLPPEEGDRFGSWVVEVDYLEAKARTKINVRCDCGAKGTPTYSALYSGASTQCRSCAMRKALYTDKVPAGYKQFSSTGYYVNKEGGVFSAYSGKLLATRVKNSGGYIEIARMYQHRLVALVYLPLETTRYNEKRWQVNHKDGNTSNNHVDNLEWVTPSENCLHAHGHSLYKTL